MGKNRFVDPSEPSVHLELSDGDWIDVKPRLSKGDELRLEGAAVGGLRTVDLQTPVSRDAEGVEMRFDNVQFAVTRFLVWIVDWSLTDARGKSVRLTRESLLALDPDFAREIDQALDRHIAAITEKKATTLGLNASRPAS